MGNKTERALSNDDDGSENVAKNMNMRSFKLNRLYLDSLNMEIKCRPLSLEFVQNGDGKFVVVCPSPP